MREIDLANEFITDYAACFEDNRDQEKIEFELETLLRQRIFGICLGYEDLNDHDELRKDPLFATICGKNDPAGNDREYERDRGIPLAGKSTLNRIEYSTTDRGTPTRYKKILYNEEAVDNYFIDKFIQQYGNKAPQ